ncbi:glutathione-dependent formaldehyde dehydrogenase [Pseudomonas sp. ZM23]|uniref:Glutathione-dependent formaldehyde dehydrogenase n=1 Tax=Pseudomonas triclosanedens TaxID=2961893 RepID=A0ABY7A895_9PSED|nr:zinc-dependent alcohol dehydrogenase [Pseudomonas triclosanedens]MCP8466259.1 glutathione-dependent formaldehyde dehydrogenase [Pseudomonas triclosanedens]MCP8471785.1 glutathione-dependent formaldehyde dehydrogenase [Pseudomonas triclosanedens]MCP8478480.1 glutathione-dependent formaldehyde dehydrogenase [Pseudomonas triclosanedens]WAI52323.1 glutathione-dependent formaldehyde dehydrogenase [Pseudomonas triclosanedens]
MKAVVFHDVGNIRLEDVPEPELKHPNDAIVRLTASAICGTDLHFVRGSVGGMKKGTILGHEGVGIIEELGDEVRNLQVGDRVVIPSTIACGNCSYCRAGYYAQCDNANPNGKRGGTAFFGGPEGNGAFHGLQAEKARIPYANIGLVRLPPQISDDQAILLSDIFPTGWFGAELAEVGIGDTVAVFGCGPVGQFAIASALLKGAARVFAIDRHPDRLHMARQQGAEVIDFEREDPVQALLWLTDGIGVDRAIDAVGVDAEHSQGGVTVAPAQEHKPEWVPGNAPAQALEWAVSGLAKAGSLGIIGVYGPDVRTFPIGEAMNKNLTLKMGNCHHRRYIPHLIELVLTERFDPAAILTQVKPMSDAIAAFEAFDQRETGWVKVELQPQRQEARVGDEETVHRPGAAHAH